MNNSKQEFGQFVASHRRTAGLTQRELADRLFVTESAVSKWERGLSYPDIAAVRSLAVELGVTADELMNASVDHESLGEKRDARTLHKTKSALHDGVLCARVAFGSARTHIVPRSSDGVVAPLCHSCSCAVLVCHASCAR